MIVLPEPLEFEWDQGNSEKSKSKHGITLEESEEVFHDESKLMLAAKQKAGEKRYMLWGKTSQNRPLTIIFTLRKRKVRVISARPMHKRERSEYEQKVETYSTI